MNTQGPKKPPTPVQAHAQTQLRGPQQFLQQGLIQSINYRPSGSEYEQQQHFAPQLTLRSRQPQQYQQQQLSQPPQQQLAPRTQLQQSQQNLHLQANTQQAHRQQQQQQIRAVPQQQSAPVSAYPAGVPHDMNKGASVGTASLPQPHTPPQIMYSNQPPRSNLMAQRQAGGQQAPAQQQPTAAMAPRQQAPRISMPSSPGPMFPGTTMFIQGQSPPFLTGQAQVITLTGPGPTATPQSMIQFQQQQQGVAAAPPQQRMHAPPQPPPYMTATQGPPTYPMQNAFNTYPMQHMTPAPTGKEIRQPTTTVYFNQGGNQSGMAPTGIQTNTRPATQPYQKQKRRGIAIIDPSTMKDISDEIYSGTPPPSEPSSCRATPVGSTPPPPSSTPQQVSQSTTINSQPQTVTTSSSSSSPSPSSSVSSLSQQSGEIAAQFANQVAAAIRGKRDELNKEAAVAEEEEEEEQLVAEEQQSSGDVQIVVVDNEVTEEEPEAPEPVEEEQKEEQQQEPEPQQEPELELEQPEQEEQEDSELLDDGKRRKGKHKAAEEKDEQPPPPPPPCAAAPVCQPVPEPSQPAPSPSPPPQQPSAITPPAEVVIVEEVTPQPDVVMAPSPVPEPAVHVEEQVLPQRTEESPPPPSEPMPPPPAPSPPARSPSPPPPSPPPQQKVQDEIVKEDETDSQVVANNEKNISEDNVHKKGEELVNNKENKEQCNREEKEKSETPVIEKKLPKYDYKEDQWSPLNPEGKKLYDRSFLLTLQFSTESTSKPAGLPNLPDIILDAPLRKGDMQQNRNLDNRDFTPGFVKSSLVKPHSGKRGSQSKHREIGGGGGGGGGGERGGGAGPKVIALKLDLKIKLHQTDNAWKPSGKDSKGDPDEEKTQALYKRVTAILNKLTPQKFQTLVQQILDLPIDTEERLKGSIDVIFEKALAEPNFSVAYASMCKYMTVFKVPSASNPKEQVLFRKLLLNRCQKEFEKDRANDKDILRREKEIEESTVEDEKKQLIAEKESAEWQAKRRSLGNIRFIGELFKFKMLTENIMHDCLFRLLKSNDEENYECLCRLLTTIGKDIDIPPKGKARVDAYFQQLDKIVRNKSTSARVRFMIQDVVELRRDKWNPRRADNNPKTIEQIHREAQQEDQQRQQHIAQLQAEQKHMPQGRGSASRRATSQQTAPVGEDGWHAVSTKSNRIDPVKMKLSKHNVDDNIQLGPGGRPGSYGSWGRGSSGGGGKTASQESEKPSSNPGNRFSALSASMENHDARSRAMGRGLPPSARADSREGKQRGIARGGGRGRSSMEQDREAAIAAARSITGGSRNQSRESSQGREEPRPPSGWMPQQQQPPPAASAAEELTEEQLERKCKSTLDEYLHIHDLKEAITCVKEMQSPQMLHLFVFHSVNHVLEKTKQARHMTGTLFHDLVKENIISVEQYLKGLLNVLEFAEDMEIDIPKVWAYFGEIIGPMIQDGSIPLTILTSLCKPLQAQKAGMLVAEVLHDAANRKGHLQIGELWKQSGLKWGDLIGNSQQKLNEFISKHKLEFTVSDGAPLSPVGRGLSRDQIEQELKVLLSHPNIDNSSIFDWVEANVGKANTKQPAFIRALITAVCSSAIVGKPDYQVDVKWLSQRGVVLKRYLDNDGKSELHALYAIQSLMHQLEHPAGVLRTLFDTLYDEEAISEDAFKQWDTGTDPAEMAGKGVARSSVEQFFTWLKNTENDTSDK